MIVSPDGAQHLTYCLNIHPGETWAENFAAIRDHALRVRQAVAPAKAFALGLRLGHVAAGELERGEAMNRFREFLAAEDLYAPTINGFPYGPFHGTAVKEDVYRPDWRTPERLDYTRTLMDILAALLPAGVAGSISTVPGAYKPWVRTDEDVARIARGLCEAALHAAEIHERTGKDLCLALEPEPDCYIETTDEALALFAETLPRLGPATARALNVPPDRLADAVRRHLGVCFDTAHAAVQFEDPAESLARLAAAGVRVPKVQLSSALRLAPTDSALRRLRNFADPVYLHQARLRLADGAVRRYSDLPEAIARAGRERADKAELRVHFHVPLFFDRSGELASTRTGLDEAFWNRVIPGTDPPAAAGPDHLEIETYTFDVLPDDLRDDDVADSIRKEYDWVLSKLPRRHA